jgi:hypothetical protein
LRGELRDELASKQDLIDMETRILKAFYGDARTNDKNMKRLGLVYSGVNDRVGVIERRVLDIEERLNMPRNLSHRRRSKCAGRECPRYGHPRAK